MSETPQNPQAARSLRERIGRGPVAFMAKNTVAANLLMLVCLVGGLFASFSIEQEVMPEFDLDMVTVQVLYPGASPAEVEQGAVLAIEEAVRGLDGVKLVRSNIEEGGGIVVVELRLSADADKALGDIKSAVDRITSFPADMERPVVSQVNYRNQVLSLFVYGDHDEHILKSLAERARDGLLNSDGISLVEIKAVRPPEISVEVPQENLRQYGLTLDQVAARVRAASVELPGGGVKTISGEVLIRTTERREDAKSFGDIVILSRPDGTQVRLSDIGTVVDGFADNDQLTTFNGKRAAVVQVFRVGKETPTSVAAAVREFMKTFEAELPPGVSLGIWKDASKMFSERVDLLVRNGLLGLCLVLLVLALFLEVRLAFWVTMGIPISLIGAFLFLPSLQVSINMISLFAFIVTLGIVVDDAIVVGEAAFEKHREGMTRMQAAIAGAREVAQPVTFSVLTTLVAFSPMLFVPGASGQFFRNVPLVVFSVLALSLVESLFILPSHIGNLKDKPNAVVRWFTLRQQRVVTAVDWFVQRFYRPSVGFAVRRRYLTLALGFATLLFTFGLVAGGRVLFVFFPKIDSDQVSSLVTLPFGANVDDTMATMKHIEGTALKALEHFKAQGSARDVMLQVGAWEPEWKQPGQMDPTGSHRGQVSVYLGPSETRTFGAHEFTEKWRELTGQVAGVDTMAFAYSVGPGSQAPIEIELAHTDLQKLEAAAELAAARLGEFAGTRDIVDGFTPGKEQLDFQLTPAARSLGLTELDLARQLRGAFYGAEATRQQRGRDELRVYVRLPKQQRTSEHDLDAFLVRTPGGGEIPLKQAATVARGRSYTKITRNDGRRVAFVSADVADGIDVNSIMEQMMTVEMPRIADDVTGLRFGYSGQQKEQKENLGILRVGFAIAILVIFALLATAFRSYIQPAIVLTAIPFGFVGAIWGHIIMGYELSLMSMMGFTALAGVVVNDSIVLVHATNNFFKQGMTMEQAAIAAGQRRFRAVLLTSLTTFFGLFPMVLETSVQARFLIPMAISLAFGVMFSTLVTLMMVPAIYIVVEDVKRAWTRYWAWTFGKPNDVPGRTRAF